MRISAHIQNQAGRHEVQLTTNDQLHSLTIPPIPALATCYFNDIYREAEKQGLRVHRVEVTVEGGFGAPGEPARNVNYRARVTAQASEEAIRSLMQQTDQVAEIQNTLRGAMAVTLTQADAVSI